MKLKPWYDVVKPREDLREGKSQDASEFAVHLDRVRDGTAREDYRRPDQFFAKTFLATNLLDLAAQTVRRMSGETSHTSPVFNLATNFGGGKTHALTLLYHLARNGAASHNWLGVSQIREKAGITKIPKARVAVFVGTEFDSLAGRCGANGEPRRTTPWGEIAWQLGGVDAFKLVAEHDEQKIAPGGDVLRKIVPENEPCLILMDELLNYASRFRKLGLNTQLYDFVLNLSGALNPQSVLAVSVPASEMEMTADDVADYNRLTKMLDRVGKAMTMTAGAETSEIVRRRLFEWDTRAVNAEGRVLLSKDAQDTCHEFARWVSDHGQQLASSVPPEHARAHFEVSYPFHPSVLSVFERKWQSVPKFQQTRGILRLLALWIQHAYTQAYRKAHPDPLLTLGTAPFGDPIFRAAVFEQLGSHKLETAMMVDIAGKKEAFATALDVEADDTIRKERLHQKVATVVFFESNGGTTRSEATVPEIRLAVGRPDLDLGNIETALDALTERCYYLTVERNRYRFSLKENLNKRFADRRANIQPPAVEERVREEIQKVFAAGSGVERIFFPEKSNQVPDRPVVTLVLLPPEQSLQDEKATTQLVETITRESGSSSRSFKSALIFCVPDAPDALRDEARKVLAWEDIDDEAPDLKLDETQIRQLEENVKKAKRDLKETIWRTYKCLMLLGKDNTLKKVDMGLVHSSAAPDMATLVINHLRQTDDLVTGVSPGFLTKHWPPAFTEWATKSVRDAFFASPQFPRLLGADPIRETISRGVTNGLLAYVGKTGTGDYKPFCFNQALMTSDIEFSEEMFLITKETAEAYLKSKASPPVPPPGQKPDEPAEQPTPPTPESEGKKGPEPKKTEQLTFSCMAWTGEVPPQKWMKFYTAVLSKFAAAKGLKLKLTVEVTPEGGISKQKIEETKAALRELGMNDDLTAM
jgi:hypothetical protein